MRLQTFDDAWFTGRFLTFGRGVCARSIAPWRRGRLAWAADPAQADAQKRGADAEQANAVPEESEHEYGYCYGCA